MFFYIFPLFIFCLASLILFIFIFLFLKDSFFKCENTNIHLNKENLLLRQRIKIREILSFNIFDTFENIGDKGSFDSTYIHTLNSKATKKMQDIYNELRYFNTPFFQKDIWHLKLFNGKKSIIENEFRHLEGFEKEIMIETELHIIMSCYIISYRDLFVGGSNDIENIPDISFEDIKSSSEYQKQKEIFYFYLK